MNIIVKSHKKHLCIVDCCYEIILKSAYLWALLFNYGSFIYWNLCAKVEEILFTGLGGALLLKERVEEELKTLQEKGKIKTSDAKSFLESLEQKGKDEDERIKAKIKDMFKEVLDELGVATKADLEKLKEDLK